MLRITKVLVIDNYDSFTYNLVHYLEDLDCEVTVKYNDAISIEEVGLFDKILLSPGPGIPDEAGILKTVIARYAPYKSIFGVCLGMQAIAEVFGGRLINLNKLFHGVATEVAIVGEDSFLFEGLPSHFEVGRYHSWAVARPLPDDLIVTSVDEQGLVMSLRHKNYDVRGVQYHPESVLTSLGKQILSNWVNGI